MQTASADKAGRPSVKELIVRTLKASSDWSLHRYRLEKLVQDIAQDRHVCVNQIRRHLFELRNTGLIAFQSAWGVIRAT